MPKNEFPWMKYFVDDIAGDPVVDAMSTLAVGAYHRLLWKAWHQCPVGSIPDDDKLLSIWARVTTEEWTYVRSEVLQAWRKKKDGRWHQKRMQKEFRFARDFSKENTKRARKAALAKHAKDRELCARALHEHCLAVQSQISESDLRDDLSTDHPEDAHAKNESAESVARKLLAECNRSETSGPKDISNTVALIEQGGVENARRWLGVAVERGARRIAAYAVTVMDGEHARQHGADAEAKATGKRVAEALAKERGGK